MANLYPKTCVKLYNLWVQGEREKAEQLQLQLAVAEWGFAKGGINGTKWVVAKYLGYAESSSACRRPFPKYTDESKQAWIISQVSGLKKIESTL